MTYQLSKLPRLRAARPAASSARMSFAAAAPTAVAAAQASTTLALSMMVALRYLEGRNGRPASASTDAIPDPVAS